MPAEVLIAIHQLDRCYSWSFVYYNAILTLNHVFFLKVVNDQFEFKYLSDWIIIWSYASGRLGNITAVLNQSNEERMYEDYIDSFQAV